MEPIKVNREELKKKSVLERFFSWIESYKKVLPYSRIQKNFISRGCYVLSNNEVKSIFEMSSVLYLKFTYTEYISLRFLILIFGIVN